MSIGVDTALNTIIEALDRIRDTATSHQRAFLIEVMGRNCGYLALMAGILGGAEIVVTPERQVSKEEVAEALIDSYIRGKTHAVAVVAEGANYSTTELAAFLEDRKDVGFEIRLSILGHMQRGGSPSAFDRRLASLLGMRAAQALRDGKSGVMVGMHGRNIDLVPLQEVTTQSREMTESYYELAYILSR
jgi:6-phosphofructokinase 1